MDKRDKNDKKDKKDKTDKKRKSNRSTSRDRKASRGSSGLDFHVDANYKARDPKSGSKREDRSRSRRRAHGNQPSPVAAHHPCTIPVDWIINIPATTLDALDLRVALCGGAIAFKTLMTQVASWHNSNGLPWVAGVALCVGHVAQAGRDSVGRQALLDQVISTGGNALDIFGASRGASAHFFATWPEAARCVQLWEHVRIPHALLAATELSRVLQSLGDVVPAASLAELLKWPQNTQELRTALAHFATCTHSHTQGKERLEDVVKAIADKSDVQLVSTMRAVAVTQWGMPEGESGVTPVAHVTRSTPASPSSSSLPTTASRNIQVASTPRDGQRMPVIAPAPVPPVSQSAAIRPAIAPSGSAPRRVFPSRATSQAWGERIEEEENRGTGLRCVRRSPLQAPACRSRAAPQRILGQEENAGLTTEHSNGAILLSDRHDRPRGSVSLVA